MASVGSCVAAKQADPGIPWYRRCRSCKVAPHKRSKDRLCPPCRSRKANVAASGSILARVQADMELATRLQTAAIQRGDTILATMLGVSIVRMSAFIAQLTKGGNT